ncbi:tetratricopeptide repeat protein [Microbacterium sp. STN6]|uniref:tetratricopeptide repeat protein n=1 Tax=Microbacterium sp. STN6 TaxID=2995588 RepID=UPI002260FE1E|nr:tetratricopeptide repeat protein [Microbacterium sp. STN6]MCX7522144.1 tetratricopeptide repeat protein [Microbacterium sp. STN6]
MSQVPPSAASLRGAVDLSALVNRPADGAAAQPGAGAVQGGASGSVPVPGLVFEGTDTNFTEFLELSMTVPVIVDLWATWCEPCKQLSPVLEKLVAEYAGRFVLVTIDVDANPQLAQAFQAQSVPTVAAIIGGRPVGLFAGALPEQQVRDVFEQVLQLAAQNGVTGTAQAPGDDETDAAAPADAEEAPAPLPPHHQEAYDAIDRGDYEAAMAEYRTAIAQDPHDRLAVAGLAQVGLLARLSGHTAEEIRDAGAAAPRDVDAQLRVADLDLSGGHIEDAFARLLDAFSAADVAGRDQIRQRLLDFFEIVGVDDPRVISARSRLASLLY